MFFRSPRLDVLRVPRGLGQFHILGILRVLRALRVVCVLPVLRVFSCIVCTTLTRADRGWVVHKFRIGGSPKT